MTDKVIIGVLARALVLARPHVEREAAKQPTTPSRISRQIGAKADLAAINEALRLAKPIAMAGERQQAMAGALAIAGIVPPAK